MNEANQNQTAGVIYLVLKGGFHLFNSVLSQTFINFAERECIGSSRLYEHLSIKISGDEALLEICMNAREGQPVPNLLFGAVHYLLLKGKEHSLKEYYPSLVEYPKAYMESYGPFRDFCFTYREEIEFILRSRRVQTNEVRRCAYLYPAFCTVHEIAKKPLALIEIGTSAGLQLLWDHYSYTYGQESTYGNSESKLTISAEIKGENVPNLPFIPPPVSIRIGLDLHTVDLNVEDEKLWLKSLIWPEYAERLSMFEKAAAYVKGSSLRLINGDGADLLPDCIQDIPENHAVCIFHTHVANQMPMDVKKHLLETIKDIGKMREVFHIYNNIQDRYLHLDYYLDGILNKNTIAETDGHGRWFKWLWESERTISQ